MKVLYNNIKISLIILMLLFFYSCNLNFNFNFNHGLKFKKLEVSEDTNIHKYFKKNRGTYLFEERDSTKKYKGGFYLNLRTEKGKAIFTYFIAFPLEQIKLNHYSIIGDSLLLREKPRKDTLKGEMCGNFFVIKERKKPFLKLVFHTDNILGVLIFIWAIPFFEKILNKLLPDKKAT